MSHLYLCPPLTCIFSIYPHDFQFFLMVYNLSFCLIILRHKHFWIYPVGAKGQAQTKRKWPGSGSRAWPCCLVSTETRATVPCRLTQTEVEAWSKNFIQWVGSHQGQRRSRVINGGAQTNRKGRLTAMADTQTATDPTRRSGFLV